MRGEKLAQQRLYEAEADVEVTDRARQAKTDELSLQQEKKPVTVSQLLTQIQDLQNKVNCLSEAREFYEPETASSSGATHAPSQHSAFPSPSTMPCRDSGLPHDPRNIGRYFRKRFGTTTCSRRTNLYSLQQFKELGILFSGIET